MNDFWMPDYKYQLVDLLSKQYPTDKHKFQAMRKRQLYAILYSVRKGVNSGNRNQGVIGTTGNSFCGDPKVCG